MSNCSGDGQCLKQCNHRKHNGYCPSNCSYNCQLKECHNYWLCKEKRPEWVLNCHNSCCGNCAIEYGKMKEPNAEDDCPICMETKKLITVTCGKHNTCLECWKKIAENQEGDKPASCPLCRKNVWTPRHE